jgi:hypothetical protein
MIEIDGTSVGYETGSLCNFAPGDFIALESNSETRTTDWRQHFREYHLAL